MAEIFQSIFGDKLVKENLVEKYNLTRLPSPQELQGKILLKGREKFTKHKPTSPVRKSINCMPMCCVPSALIYSLEFRQTLYLSNTIIIDCYIRVLSTIAADISEYFMSLWI